MWSYIYKLVYWLLPSHVCNIAFLDPQSDKIQTRVYRKKMPHTSGFFVFKVWNREKYSFEYYILRNEHVCIALGLTDIDGIHKKTHWDIVRCISQYVRYSPLYGSYSIFDIRINGCDTYMQLYPYLKSFYIKKNVTPHALDILFTYINNGTRHDRQNAVHITDFNFEQLNVEYDNFIFT